MAAKRKAMPLWMVKGFGGIISVVEIGYQDMVERSKALLTVDVDSIQGRGRGVPIMRLPQSRD